MNATGEAARGGKVFEETGDARPLWDQHSRAARWSMQTGVHARPHNCIDLHAYELLCYELAAKGDFAKNPVAV